MTTEVNNVLISTDQKKMDIISRLVSDGHIDFQEAIDLLVTTHEEVMQSPLSPYTKDTFVFTGTEVLYNHPITYNSTSTPFTFTNGKIEYRYNYSY